MSEHLDQELEHAARRGHGCWLCGDMKMLRPCKDPTSERPQCGAIYPELRPYANLFCKKHAGHKSKYHTFSIEWADK